MSLAIPRRDLGQQGLQVSAIGLGCMGMSDFYGPADEATNLKVLHHSIDIGVTFFDTADMYGVGANERLISQVLKTRRNEVVLATKFGIRRGANGERLGLSGRPEYVREACDASLQRLGVDHIDLYYQHRVDPTVPIEETVGAMGDLVKAGKVRYLGLSEASGKTVKRAHAVHPISALQTEYSLWTRDLESDALPVCQKLGVGIVPYSPLGRGFLTGAINSIEELAADDFRRGNPRFAGENFAANLKLVAVVREIAQQCDATPAQVALAWLLHSAPNIVPIPGTRSVSRLTENAGACSLVLDDAQMERLQGVLWESPVSGARYTPDGMGSIDR
jgi:aryl-alcohol dehydrogenase-like predicted oxidoreductase